jgi:hypothetical protein
MRKPTAVSDLLAEGQAKLQGLRAGAKAAGHALAAVRSTLPTEVAAHVFGAALDGEVLTVLVDGGGWATRARYALAGLAPDLGIALGAKVTRVRIRVRPPPGGGAQPPKAAAGT